MGIALGIPTRNGPALATLKRGEERFRLDTRDWHPDLIEVPSDDDDLVMTPERCANGECIRNDFEEKPCVPKSRDPLKHLQTVWDMSKTTRLYPYQLFPRGDGQQFCKIARTRRPSKLMPGV